MLRLCRPSPHLVSLCRVNSILAWVSSRELVFELKTRNCLAFCGFTLLSLFWVPSLGNGAPAWVFAVWNLFTRAKQLMRRSDKPVSGRSISPPIHHPLPPTSFALWKSCLQGRGGGMGRRSVSLAVCGRSIHSKIDPISLIPSLTGGSASGWFSVLNSFLHFTFSFKSYSACG